MGGKSAAFASHSGEVTQMKKRNFVSQRGYSLIEIMIVLVISAILATFAIARFGNAGTNFKRQNISRELKINLERARFDSVKRRAEVVTTATGTTDSRAEITLVNATSFTVKTDLNQNGTLDASDTRTIDFTGQSNVKIVGDALVFPITIKFDRYGRIEAKNGAAPPQDITPIFTICTDNCTAADATAANGDVIYVSPSGTVAMLNGGESKPNFVRPIVTVVEVDKNINEQLRVK